LGVRREGEGRVFLKEMIWKYLWWVIFGFFIFILIIIKGINVYENLFKILQSLPPMHFLSSTVFEDFSPMKKIKSHARWEDYSPFPLLLPLSSKLSPPFPTKLPNTALGFYSI
jgi:hypothetical protein